MCDNQHVNPCRSTFNVDRHQVATVCERSLCLVCVEFEYTIIYLLWSQHSMLDNSFETFGMCDKQINIAASNYCARIQVSLTAYVLLNTLAMSLAMTIINTRRLLCVCVCSKFAAFKSSLYHKVDLPALHGFS